MQSTHWALIPTQFLAFSLVFFHLLMGGGKTPQTHRFLHYSWHTFSSGKITLTCHSEQATLSSWELSLTQDPLGPGQLMAFSPYAFHSYLVYSLHWMRHQSHYQRRMEAATTGNSEISMCEISHFILLIIWLDIFYFHSVAKCSYKETKIL